MAKVQYVDENARFGADLDDVKFVKSREVILLLLPKLFKKESSRWSSLEIMEHFIDEAVAEIAYIWKDS